MKRRFVLASAVLSVCVGAVAWGDWAGFRGPNRDGISDEKGLIKDWAAKQPELLWKLGGMGKGYSSVSIVNGKLFTMGDRGAEQFVIAFDLATRKELWATKVGKGWGDGSRCTPTVDGDLAYVLGTHGDLLCVNVADGKEVWRKNFPTDFGGKMMSGWAYSESPLIDGDKLICTPGGPDATLVALNKKTGELIWKSSQGKLGPKGKDGAAYSSIVIGQGAGVKQYITLTGRGAIGVRAEDGKFLWGYNKAINDTANITNPVVKGDLVFASSAYGTGSALLKLSSDGQGGVKAEEVYFLDAKTFANHHGGVVLVGDYLYGGTGQNAGLPVCIEMATGKIVWKAPKAEAGGSAAVLFADGNVIFRYEKDAVVALVAATPDGYKLQGTFKAVASDGPSWAHPVINDGKLYLRSNDTLMCYNVSGK